MSEEKKNPPRAQIFRYFRIESRNKNKLLLKDNHIKILIEIAWDKNKKFANVRIFFKLSIYFLKKRKCLYVNWNTKKFYHEMNKLVVLTFVTKIAEKLCLGG